MSLEVNIVPGLPTYGPMATAIPPRFARTGMQGLVIEFKTGDDAWVANFRPGSYGIDLAGPHPNGRDAVVIAKGDLFIVDVDRRSGELLLTAVDAALEVSDPTGWIFSRQGLALARLGPTGLLWHTKRLSWDGFDKLVCAEGMARGLAWSPIDNCWYPFEVDMTTGRPLAAVLATTMWETGSSWPGTKPHSRQSDGSASPVCADTVEWLAGQGGSAMPGPPKHALGRRACNRSRTMNDTRAHGDRRLTVTHDAPLLAWLLDTLHEKRSAVKNLLKFGAVRVNGAAIRQFDHPLVAGDEVAIGQLGAAMAQGQLEQAWIRQVYEDDALVVVDKPAGLLTVATNVENLDTLYVRLNAYLRARNPAHPDQALVTHRLDRETSGLVLFAKSESIKRQLQAAWPTVEKVYQAIVRGRPDPGQGTVSSYLVEDSLSLKVAASNDPSEHARLATTHYRVLETCGRFSLVEVRLETGRKHQIRVHLASLKCPVVGDRRYGKASRVCDRLALHATRLRLLHPLTGQPLDLHSPLPRPLGKLIT